MGENMAQKYLYKKAYQEEIFDSNFLEITPDDPAEDPFFDPADLEIS
jgi:hypothetical protein